MQVSEPIFPDRSTDRFFLNEIGVVSGVVSSTESESDRKNQNVPISSDSVYVPVAYEPVETRLSKAEAEKNQPITRPEIEHGD